MPCVNSFFFNMTSVFAEQPKILPGISGNFLPFPFIPAYSSLFKHILAYSSLFQPIPVYSRLCQPIQTHSSQFHPIPSFCYSTFPSSNHSIIPSFHHLMHRPSIWDGLITSLSFSRPYKTVHSAFRDNLICFLVTPSFFLYNFEI